MERLRARCGGWHDGFMLSSTGSVASAAAVVGAFAAFGCSIGQGAGEVQSDRLRMENCWDGPYNMAPDFFAGVPYRSSFQVRVQRGGDIEEISDGLSQASFSGFRP